MSKILEFLEKEANYFALIFCLIFLLATFFSVQGNFWEGLKFSGFALTSDEVSHIPAGYYYLKTQKYFINAEHPPLIKDIAAIPLLFLNLNLPQIPEELRYENIQWDFGSNFLFGVGNNPDLITFFSRTIIILFNGLLLFLVYYFLKKIFGALPSLISLFLLVFSPNLIAHGSLVVFDVPLALLCLLSILAFSLFLRDLTENRKFWQNFIFALLFTGLTLLTKFQAIFLPPSLFFGGLIYILFVKKEFWKKYLLLFIFFSVLILIFIGLIHGFQTINMTVKGLQHQISYSYPLEWPSLGRNFLHRLSSLNIFVLNGLIEYLVGLMMMISRAAGAWQSTYFMGNVYGSEGASFTYFPVLFFTKETLGFLFLLFLTILSSIRNFLKNNQFKQKVTELLKNPFNATCLVFFLIYALFSLTLKLNIGIRHIFPITFLLYVLVAKKISSWLPLKISILKKEVKISFLLLPFFIIIITAWILTWPYFLSYYNILAGGTSEGYKIATNSNYDWGGQDVKKLGKWVEENKIERIYTHIFSNVPLNYYLGQAYKPFNIRTDPIPPKDSLIAVSTFELQNVNYDKELPESKKYFQFEDNLIQRVGTTIFIFQVK
ncbi:phospholipid carrier-dependent glycosyltransferase [Candidatus Parcubacteria bacterium]|uniref:Glycosyltransferase RgtA/B/C/D-like domain-containing protein n=1 Tax=Candidatus Jorgensenbacteria bacterium CG11_big_fil_rev_8_21_14_0_20_38_23 TaxID=1974594 RepID=A0A2H0NDI2_9BACT|nr:phospholipid carrier-dependent glycosyltransferase [Candidatus Parcubacteria bacterium]PIR06924.1 MAG: hypothetical protein COV54_01850 [Candidatus Jorgensenbacteria bacterium CG11_big_fil_rev_8_21_14_0_20_38_23]